MLPSRTNSGSFSASHGLSHGLRSGDNHQSPTQQLMSIQQGNDPRLPNQHMKPPGEWDYLGAVPPGTLELLLPLPSPDSDFGYIDEKDPVTKHVMDHIRKDCHVWMVVSREHVLLFAFSFSNLQKGLRRVRALSLAIAQDMVCRTVSLVHRSIKDIDGPVLMKSVKEVRGLNRGTDCRWRGIALSQALAGDAMAMVNTDANPTPLTAQSLSLAIRRAAHGICPVLGDLRVRVQFGILTLAKRKFGDFKTVLEEAAQQGLISFRQEFGGEDLTTRILERIYRTQANDSITPRFIAEDHDIDELRDVKPKYCLMFFSGNHRLEIDVQYEHDGPYNFTASAPRVYKSFNKSLVADIAVACPDDKFDWRLSVESDAGADMVDVNFRNLAKVLRFGVTPVNHFEFPVIKAPRPALFAAKIENMVCKVYWTFSCVSHPYCVEVAVTHDWKNSPLSTSIKDHMTPYIFTFNTANARVGPIKSCLMSLYGVEWEDKIRGMDLTSGQFENMFSDLFSHQGDAETGAGQLLEEIEYLQGIAAIEAGGPEHS